ncbi:unnamed protein product [Cylicocyclus nassatus]|uniref:Uncharacterized protein n=1 Tax=Cylicocyclus nassatus TaxID=53992 RepID=A0AA36MCB5_CYLNA|nr:unnamed protein product [Cylicocyclus nassatus]
MNAALAEDSRIISLNVFHWDEKRPGHALRRYLLNKVAKGVLYLLDRLNEELVQNRVQLLGRHSRSDVLELTYCQKAFVPRKTATTLVSQIDGNYTQCQSTYSSFDETLDKPDTADADDDDDRDPAEIEAKLSKLRLTGMKKRPDHSLRRCES